MTLFDGERQPVTEPRRSTAVGVAEIGHNTVRAQLSEYLDGSLTERERARLDEHLQACPPCRAYLATLKATIDAVGNLPREKAPESAKQRLLDTHEVR